MRSRYLFIFLILSIIFCNLTTITAQPTEESLISAWEKLQKSDPKTVIFEKKEKDLYRFMTEQFPFDGELRILNVIIDDRMSSYEYGSIMGVIEVELVDLPEDFLQKYSYSYSLWITKNTLFYDEESLEWLTSNEYYYKTQPRYQSYTSYLTNYLATCGYIFILIIVLVVIFVLAHNMQKRNKKYLDDSKDSIKKSLEIAEKSLQLTEESNNLLKEILTELKGKDKQ